MSRNIIPRACASGESVARLRSEHGVRIGRWVALDDEELVGGKVCPSVGYKALHHKEQ